MLDKYLELLLIKSWQVEKKKTQAESRPITDFGYVSIRPVLLMHVILWRNTQRFTKVPCYPGASWY